MSAAPDSIPPDCRGDHRLPARLGCHLHMPRPKKRAANGRPYYPSFLYHPTQKCHCLPSRRFATTGLSFTPPATVSLFTTANAFPRETLPRTNGIPEQSAKFVALQIPELLMGFGSRLRARSSAALTGLAAARSRSGSDSPPDCHSLPSRRFATTGLSFTPPATVSLFTTANAFPRETLPRTNGIPEQSTTFVALQIPLAKKAACPRGAYRLFWSC